MAAKKKAAKKAKGEKAEKTPALKFGHDKRISGVVGVENPRRAETNGYSKFDDMQKFMKKNPKATVADVIAGTTYKRNDYEWDLEREVFKAVSA